MEGMNFSLDSINESFESSDVVLTAEPKAAAKKKRSASAQKSYVCSYCPKTYTHSNLYKKHLAQHTNLDKPTLVDCNERRRQRMTEFGLRKHKRIVHGDKRKTEKTVNNNNQLPAIDSFKIFKSKEPTYVTDDYVQAKIPRSPYSDDYSNLSPGSAVSSASSISHNETSSTVNESSLTSHVGPVDFEEEKRYHDENILKILRNEIEKNFVDVVLCFNEY